jgi:RHS repeat-associated protein
LLANGTFVNSLDYTPFGQIFSGDTSDPYLFTGKERDTESGNDFFNARYYASTTGRFLSPDPSGLAYAHLANPQSLNLYSYVRNNPLRFVDPTGLAGCQLEGMDTSCNGLSNNEGAQACPDNNCNEQPSTTQQMASSRPGFWGRLGQRFHNFFHNQGFVTNDELIRVRVMFGGIVPGSMREVEPEEANPAVSLGLDAVGTVGTLTGHDVLAKGTAVGSMFHDPSAVSLQRGWRHVLPESASPTRDGFGRHGSSGCIRS